MPVARYGACEIVWHIWELPVVAKSRVVPVVAYNAGMYLYKPALQKDGPLLYCEKCYQVSVTQVVHISEDGGVVNHILIEA